MATKFVDSEANAPAEESTSMVSIQSNTNKDSENRTETASGGGHSPGRFGTYMSFLLIFVGIILSIILYSQGKNISLDSFEDGCPDSYMDACKAVAGVMRVSMALTIVFGMQGLMTYGSATLFDSLWGLKLAGFAALVVGLFFASSKVFGTGGYAWFARITGFLYLILQQIILLDLAYTWNERWVDFATNSEGERGKKWLYGLLFISFIFFAGAFAVFGLLYWQFSDCDNNIVIITLALGFCLIASITQLFFSNEGSVLTSAIMTAYSAYITYSAVTLNPNDSCNPTLNTDYQTLSAIIGLGLTCLSIFWTTYNTVNKIPQITTSTGESITIANASSASNSAAASASSNVIDQSVLRNLLAQVSFVFLLVSGYYAMILTNWATFQDSASIYDPRTGRATMWIQAAGQWIAVTLYLWSLIAPKILTNREF